MQSKPGWPVRPAVSQSAWGQPITTAVSQPQPAVSQSPRAQRPAAAAPPVRMPVAQPTPPKQPSDVSRQLFPDTSNQAPITHQQPPAAISKPRAPVAPVQRLTEPPQQPPQSMPPQYVSQSQVYQPSMPGGDNKPYMSAQVRPPAPIGSVPGPIGSVSKMQQQQPRQQNQQAYSPFIDSHMSKPIQPPSQQPHNMSSGPSMVVYPTSMGQQHPDPMKAPGFRPTAVSPQLSQYSQHLVLQTSGSMSDDFSRAPGSRPSAEQLTSPLSSHSISSNVHTLFSNSTQSPRGNVPSHSVAANMAGLMNPLQNQYSNQYTTRDQPMTLPEISSSLNPNASEFSIPHKLASENQHSPRNMGTIGSKQQISPNEYKQQYAPGSGLNHRSVGADNSDMMRQMMYANSSPGMQQQSINPMTGLLQTAPGQMPIGMQPQRTYSPAAGTRPMMTPPMDPTMSHQLDDSPPGLQSDMMESKGPRPIGGERSRRTPVFSDPVDSAIWSTNPAGRWFGL